MAPMMHDEIQGSEAQRIVAELARRDQELGSDYYALYYPANLYFHQGHEEALLWALRKLGVAPVGARRVLDVGCGYGDWIGVFQRFGARRESLAGIELAEPRVAQAALQYPGADLRHGDACKMPWPDQSFDIVFQRTIVSSILDVEIQQQVVREMLRVLRPGGAISVAGVCLRQSSQSQRYWNQHQAAAASLSRLPDSLSQHHPGATAGAATSTCFNDARAGARSASSLQYSLPRHHSAARLAVA
jgi:SAM-dependent methyltransferase